LSDACCGSRILRLCASHKQASQTEGPHDFGSGPSSAQVGRVSPRPQNRGRNCYAVRPRTVARVKSIGPNRAMGYGDPAVSERRALPARSTDRHLRLTRTRAAAWPSPAEPNSNAIDRSGKSGTDTYLRDNGSSHGTDMDSRSRGAHQC
jgi:hypothetical protein